MNCVSTTPIWVTALGFAKLQQQLAHKQQEYAQVREHRQVAFELSGDGWHDNPEFNRMQQLEANLNHTVKTLSDQIEQARVVEIIEGMRPLHEVAIGAVVSLQRWAEDADQPSIETWEIVGFEETDLSTQKLAYNAPLAAAVYGLHVGDVAESVRIGSRLWDIEVLALHPARQAAGLA